MPYTKKQVKFFNANNIPYDKDAPVVDSKEDLHKENDEKGTLRDSEVKSKKKSDSHKSKKKSGHKCDLGKYCPLCMAEKAMKKL